jgi:hypothetical protein
MFTPNRSPGRRRCALIRLANHLAGIRGGIVGGVFWRPTFSGDSHGSASRHDIRHRLVRGGSGGYALAGLHFKTFVSVSRFGTLPSPGLRHV